MSEPRNVTPPGEGIGPPAEGVPPTGPSERFRTRYYEERREEPEWLAWRWASRGRGFPWLGVLLVLVGAALLLQYFVPVGAGTLVLLAIGIAFLAGWIFGNSLFAMVPGVLFVALGLARLAEDAGVVDAPGVTSLALAAAFLVIWLIAYTRGRRWTLALWAAAIFGLIGFVRISGTLVGMPDLGLLWPIVLIVIGFVVLANARRRSSP